MATSAYTESEKTTEINLHVPFSTNGKVLRGKVTVPMSVAEDLLRRQHDYDVDQRKHLENNGKTVDALSGGSLKG